MTANDAAIAYDEFELPSEPLRLARITKSPR
jgi:hypothetical protein